MRTGFGIQDSGFSVGARAENRKWKAGNRKWGPISHFRFPISAFLLLVTCHSSLVTAFAATHVTGTYNLGANPAVMATINGTPEYGLIFVQRNKLVTYSGVQYGTQVENAYLDASGQLNDGTGHLWIDLIPSTTATPGDSYYVVTVNIQGTVHSEIWVVPDTATIDVALVRQAQPGSGAAPAPFYQVVQQAGSDLPQRLRLNMTGSGVACADNAGALSTDCTVTGGGGGPTPLASSTTSGTVKTDATAADPVVYLKTSADTLLAAKANSSHTHAQSDVTSLVTDLAGKVPTSRTVSTTAPLSGGGALSSNLALSMPAASGSQDGYLSSGNWTTFNSKESALTFNSPLSRSVNAISCPTCELTGNKNTASGYAGLTASSKLNASQGQEVWSVADLTDYSATSGAGSTALKSTVTSPSSGQCLTWSGSDWVNGACSGGSSNHNLLSSAHPDTAAASPVFGDLLYANSTPAWTKLAGNTTTTKKYLSQTGNGSISAAPAWAQVAAGDISGLAASATTDTTNASNISSGTIPDSRLPNPTSTTKGGVRSKDCTGTGHVLSINTDSTVTCSADAGGGGGASTGDSFVTISHDADLTGERVLAAGSAISLTEGGANSSATIAFDPTDSSTFWIHEDFCGVPQTNFLDVNNGWNWTVIGTSGIAISAPTPTTIPNMCFLRGTTSGTSGRGGNIKLQGDGGFGGLGTTSNSWKSRFTWEASATASIQLYVGFTSTSSTAQPPNFMGMRLDTSATSPGADSAFSFVVCKTSTCTRHATTYAADTTWHTMRLSWDGTSLTFQLDGNASLCFNSGGTGGCTASGNIPTANLHPIFQIVQTSGSAQTLDADFFAFAMTGLSR